jgi:hypothetical protein
MRLLFNAELSVDAESLEEAWKLAKDVEAEASALSNEATLLVKMASITVLEDGAERHGRRHDARWVAGSARHAGPAGARRSARPSRRTGR